MKLKPLATIAAVLTCMASCSKNEQAARSEFVDEAFEHAEQQCSLLIKETDQRIDDAAIGTERSGDVKVSPRTLKGNELVLAPAKDWTSGFFPGMLWYLYEYTGEKKWLEQAKVFTARIEGERWNGKTHDMGFKIFCSVGHAYRLIQDSAYKRVIIQSAATLSKRFKAKAGVLRSWDHNKDKWDCPVIIDNLMNLELLFAATKLAADSSFYKIADSHARMTIKNHYRADGSSYHVVDYDTITGVVKKKQTHQGYADESAWSRGQAWGLYGFTMCYRETGKKIYLEQAEKIAKFIFDHPNLPADLVPYWDFDAPSIPQEPRDASAAAIIASALCELYWHTNKSSYLERADEILINLRNHYTSPLGQSKGFILLHSTGSRPSNSEVDVPLIYADYYFIEALLRRKHTDEKQKMILTTTK